MDFNKYTDKAKEALALSQEVLTRYQHTQLDLEHLLLALLEQPGGVTSQILDLIGIDRQRLQRAAEGLLARAPKVTAQGGAAQIYAQCVKKIPNVYLEQFGSPEAVWEMQVEGFPAVVTMDSHGNSLHKEIQDLSHDKLKQML